ncbi:MAG TPA: hypothetical protein VIK89_13890, partial [Cytophagaceae bacterium]
MKDILDNFKNKIELTLTDQFGDGLKTYEAMKVFNQEFKSLNDSIEEQSKEFITLNETIVKQSKELTELREKVNSFQSNQGRTVHPKAIE